MTNQMRPSRDLLTRVPDSLVKLNQAIDELERSLSASTDHVHIDVIRNIAIEPIESLIRYRLLEDGKRTQLTFGGYGPMQSELLDPDSELLQSDQAVLMSAISLQKLDPDFGRPRWSSDLSIGTLENLFVQCRSSKAKTILINNFPLPPLAPPGNRFIRSSGGLEREITAVNEFIETWVSGNGPRFCLLDWARTARQCGEENTYDYRYLHMHSMPFKRPFLDGVAIEVRSVLRTLGGKTKKVLVLDCDNTLWGGVVGEVGVEGIQLHAHDYPGNVYYEFQKSVLQLHANGVLICLCSKNNESEVLDVLSNHPWSLIRKNHIAAHRINWEEKPGNIESLASELNLGLDSMVFIDDNPREIESVRQMLPDVTTIPVPRELHEYPQLLARESLFDKLSIGAEDEIRTNLYQQEKSRAETQKQFSSYIEYLESLEQKVQIKADSVDDVNRIAELTQKTNQFNLTTRRYSVQDIRNFMDDDAVRVYSISATDKFGPLGLIGVMILQIDGNIGSVDTLLMSCRALRRGLEEYFVLASLEMERQRQGIDEWHATFRPTQKNALAKEFWESLGFEKLASEPDESRFQIGADVISRELPDCIELLDGAE